MKYDVVVCGLADQGVGSIAKVIERGAVRAGLECAASEVGTSDGLRGTFVHLRLADHPIDGNSIAPGTADLILGTEPLESLRHLAFLSPAGSLITSSVSVPDGPAYPPVADVLWSVLSLRSGFLVDALRCASETGIVETANIAMVGAASDFLPIDAGDLRAAIIDHYSEAGTSTVENNLTAFESGRNALRHREEIVDEFTTFADARH